MTQELEQWKIVCKALKLDVVHWKNKIFTWPCLFFTCTYQLALCPLAHPWNSFSLPRQSTMSIFEIMFRRCIKVFIKFIRCWLFQLNINPMSPNSTLSAIFTTLGHKREKLDLGLEFLESILDMLILHLMVFG